MIEKFSENDEFINALSILGGFFIENPKIGGEFVETFLVETFNRLNLKSEKVAGRKKADIVIDNQFYSVKSSTIDGSQIDTLSNGHITIQKLVELDNKTLINDNHSKYKILLSNKTEILEKICESLDKMTIIFFNCKIDSKNNEATFRISELTHEELVKHIKNVDEIYYERPSNRNKITLVKDGKTLFTIKDGTGTSTANAFQRGIWTGDVSFISNYKYFEKIKIKRMNFYEN